MSKVAEVEGTTRPAVSQQLAQLEAETGLTLIERAGRGVQLTGSAVALLAESQPLFEALASIDVHLESARAGISGEIRVSAFTSVASLLLPTAVVLLRSSHPMLRVRVREQEPSAAVQDLAAHRVDMAVVDDLTVDEFLANGVELQPLLTDRLFAAVPEQHPLATRSSLSLTDLAGEPWAVSAAASLYRDHVEGLCRNAGFAPIVAAECQQTVTVLNFIRHAGCISVLPGLSLRDRPAGVRVLPFTQPLERHIHVAVARGRSSAPAVRAVIDAMREALEVSES